MADVVLTTLRESLAAYGWPAHVLCFAALVLAGWAVTQPEAAHGA